MANTSAAQPSDPASARNEQLLLAAFQGNKRSCQGLLASGVNVSVQSQIEPKMTPLMMAAAAGHTEVTHQTPQWWCR